MPALSDELQEALVIPVPEDPALVLDGCRRLLGPNLYDRQPGAVGDTLSPGFAPALVLESWSGHTRRLLDALAWPGDIRLRPFAGGGSLFFAARPDRLFTAAFVIEAAFHFTACDLLGRAAMDFDALVASLTELASREANPALVALLAEAGRRGVDHLLDNDAVTIGHGAGSRTWATGELPPAPDWAALHDIPLALVTGTNGKTTTTRLIAAIAAATGAVAGLSSTEFVRVGDRILDRGDYAGPAGARLLLRDSELELGVLEVARGGILRRGLPVTRARAAVVTNVAADHLGQYGIMTVPELAEVKLSARRALAPGGWLILNAEDAMLRASAAALSGPPVWFARDGGRVEITGARTGGRPCAWVADGWIWLSDGKSETRLVAVGEVPLTLGGAAAYNVENVLGAALAARALGLPDAAIVRTLKSFRSDAKDNPGRANEFTVNGARVFVDFAHNPHSIAAVTSALAALPGARRFVLLTHAGDRSDDEIRALAQGAFAMRPDVVVAAENQKYLRGRPLGEVPALIRGASLGLGLAPEDVLLADSPAAGARLILDRLAPGDLALLLVHDQRPEIFAMLSASPA